MKFTFLLTLQMLNIIKIVYFIQQDTFMVYVTFCSLVALLFMQQAIFCLICLMSDLVVVLLAYYVLFLILLCSRTHSSFVLLSFMINKWPFLSQRRSHLFILV